MRIIRAFWPLLTVAGPVLGGGSGALAAPATPQIADAPQSATAFINSYRHHPHRSDSSSGSDTDGNADNLNVLPSFAGVWVADGNEPMQLAAGCMLMYRVAGDSKQLTRAVLCTNGNVQTDVAPISGLSLENSPFPGAFALRTQLGDGQGSCSSDQTSTVAPLTSLVFDLKTAAGGDPATIAYTQLGTVALALHSGDAIDTFDRNRDCKSIVQTASGLADNADNAMVKLAAKLCNLDTATAGCFTADGYAAPGSSPSSPSSPFPF